MDPIRTLIADEHLPFRDDRHKVSRLQLGIVEHLLHYANQLVDGL